MKRSAIYFAFISCLVLFLSAPRGEAARDSWVSVRSKNFLLIGNASEKEIGRVAIRLEQFREVFSRLFDRASITSPVPTTVVVFKNDRSFAPFRTGVNTAGYFQGGPDVNYITLTAEGRGEQDPFSVIFHEYTHLLISNAFKNAPTWFNEGLAEYYSTATVNEDQKFVLGKPIGSHVNLLREKGLLPLKMLTEVDHDSPYYNERDKQSLFYAQSWALTHYLILGRGTERGSQIGKFIDALKANLNAESAFKQAFEVSLEQIEKELREYIRKGRYPVISGHSQAKSEFDQGLVVAALTEAQAQAYLGDLLLHSYRSDAENYLKKALELDPELTMAHASLGMLRAREGRLAEALQSLEKAVATSSDNYLIHYYYAFALSREGNADSMTGFSPEDTNRMRAHLNKAIELRPDFLESYGLLAYVNLVSNSNIDESEQVLKRILAGSPERGDLAFMLAQIYMAKDNYASAREILQKLSDNERDADLLRRCQNLLAGLERIQSLRASRATSSASSNADYGSQGEPSLYVDPSTSLREALRKPEPGEAQIQGLLTRIDCDSRGITFSVQVDNRVLRLTTSSFKQLRFKSFSSDSGREVICGPRTPENNVVVTYVPAAETSAKSIGIAKLIEFVPKDFKF